MNKERLSLASCTTCYHRLIAAQVQPDGGELSLFMSMALSQGHTAIRYEGGRVFPSVASLVCDLDSGIEIGPDSSFAEEVERHVITEIESGKFQGCFQGGSYLSMAQVYDTERAIMCECQRLARCGTASSPVPLHCVSQLNEGQRRAVQGTGAASVSAITGGPGTGKTFTAAFAVAASSIGPSSVVGLLAPTGRAAQHLSTAMAKSWPLESRLIVETKTIHRALQDPAHFLPYQVVVVDEASMIDSSMMLQLVRRIHEGTKLILLGDPNQLPSINPGQPFFDLVTAQFPVTTWELTQCHRIENTELRLAAQAVTEHDDAELLRIMRNTSGAIEYLDLDCAPLSSVRDLVIKEIVNPWTKVSSLQMAEEQLSSRALLCATRHGPIGVEAMNRLGRSMVGHPFSPLLSTHNDYQLNIMNGDLGIEDQRSGYVHFGERSVPRLLCPHLAHAYAMTVHKSQGSEFDTVVCLIPPDARCDVRLLYTAITRAKRRLVVVASSRSLQNMCRDPSHRESVLAYLLRHSSSH